MLLICQKETGGSCLFYLGLFAMMPMPALLRKFGTAGSLTANWGAGALWRFWPEMHATCSDLYPEVLSNRKQFVQGPKLEPACSSAVLRPRQ